MAFDKEKMMPNVELTEEEEALLDNPETLENVANMLREQVEQNNDLNRKLNRAQRRMLEKKSGKNCKRYARSIGEVARKLNYIEIIQKLRKLNEKNENEKENIENEGIIENS